MMSATHRFASASLYVGDLNRDVTEAMLYEIFNQVGPVASIRVCRDSVTRRSLGYAYVNYHSVTDAERALDTLNYTNIKSVPCRIMWCYRDPALRKSGAGNVFVKNLDRNIDHKALYDTFSLFGNILSCKVAQDEDGKSRGFGFVHYETEDAAKTAIERVNHMQIGSKTVYVGPFIRRNERHSIAEMRFTNVYIKNIPLNWDEEAMEKLFGQFGMTTSIAIQLDNKGRKFGFVNFENSDSARTAVTVMHMRKIDELNKSLGEPYEQSKEVKREEVCLEGEKEIKESTESHATEASKSSTGDAADMEASSPEEQENLVKEEVETTDQEKTEEAKEGETVKLELPEMERVANASSPKEDAYLYVGKFQPKSERIAQLRQKFDNEHNELRQKQFVNLFLKNLHDTIDEKELRKMFEPFGTVTSTKVMRDDKDVSKGFGFVCFFSMEEATKAITEMHKKVIEGKSLFVGLAERREEREDRMKKWRVTPNRQQVSAVPPQISFGAPSSLYFGQQNLTPAQSAMLDTFPGGHGGTGPGAPAGNRMPMMHQFPPNQAMQSLWSRSHMRGLVPPNTGQLQGITAQPPMGPGGGYPQQVGVAGSGSTINVSPQGPPMGLQSMAGAMNFVGLPRGSPTPRVMFPTGARSIGGQLGQAMPMSQSKQPNMKYLPQMRNRELESVMWSHGGGGPNMGFMPHAPPAGNVNMPGGALPSMPMPMNTAQSDSASVDAVAANVSNSLSEMTLTDEMLSALPPAVQKQMIGEKLFPRISKLQSTLAGKITGMMLDMDNVELLKLLDSDALLRAKVEEALRVLHHAQQQTGMMASQSPQPSLVGGAPADSGTMATGVMQQVHRNFE